MYPKIKFVKGDDNKKLFTFWGDPLLFDQCRKKNSPCGLIAAGVLAEADGSVLSPKMISAVAIEMWRLEKRLSKIKDTIREKVGSEADAVYDQLQRIRDCLGKYEIEIKEYTGESYNDGLSLRALHVETDENLPRGTMMIIETVKPSVYLKGNIISHGEVVVAKSKEN